MLQATQPIDFVILSKDGEPSLLDKIQSHMYVSNGLPAVHIIHPLSPGYCVWIVPIDEHQFLLSLLPSLQGSVSPEGHCCYPYPFTKVPVDLTVKGAHERLSMDTSLIERISLSADQVVKLLRFCLDATFLSYRGDFYQQTFGTAMGSPVSVTVANLVMEDVEQRALSSYPSPPPFWKRYVDDTLTALPQDQVQCFHEHLTSSN